MRKKMIRTGQLVGLVVALVVSMMPRGAADTRGEWPVYAADTASTKYSPLDQITRDNVKHLRIAWRQSATPVEVRQGRTDAPVPVSYEHTPLMVGGLLYMSTGYGTVAALDPTTGKVVWFDAPLERTAQSGGEGQQQSGRGSAKRGVTYWTDGQDARIIAITGQSLVALNAKTGERYADFGVGGTVDLTKGYDRPADGFSWGSPPVVVRDVIVIGGLGGPVGDAYDEFVLARKEGSPAGVRGYDVRTGALLWTFHTIPRVGKFGHNTWLYESSKYSGDANVWGLMSADEELGYVYLPIGTATGDYYGGARPGENLFAESLVCLDAKTGKRIWHFQAVHHGLWDYDFNSVPNLLDITVNGRKIKAVAQISKQAFVYVFDRVTGQPVWPIEERPVPAGDAPGEWYASTQPFPTKPPAYDQQGVTIDDLIDFTPELRQEALEIISQYRYGPLFTPPSVANGSDRKKGTIQMPGTVTTVWNGAGVDPETSILYVPSVRSGVVIELVKSRHPRSNLRLVRKGLTWVMGPRARQERAGASARDQSGEGRRVAGWISGGRRGYCHRARCRPRVRPSGLPAADPADSRREGRCGLRLSFHRRPVSPGALLLAFVGEPVSDLAEQDVHQPQPHGHGDLLQGVQTRGHPADPD